MKLGDTIFAENLIGADSRSCCACFLRLCEFISFNGMDLQNSQSPQIFFGFLYSFCCLFPQGSVSPELKDLMETYHLGLSVPSLSSSAYCLHVDLCICSTSCRRKFRWWWQNKALIYDYSRMSLEVMKSNFWFSLTWELRLKMRKIETIYACIGK